MRVPRLTRRSWRRRIADAWAASSVPVFAVAGAARLEVPGYLGHLPDGRAASISGRSVRSIVAAGHVEVTTQDDGIDAAASQAFATLEGRRSESPLRESWREEPVDVDGEQCTFRVRSRGQRHAGIGRVRGRSLSMVSDLPLRELHLVQLARGDEPALFPAP